METVKEKLMDELKSLDWYHVNGVTGRLVHGSNSGEVSYWKCADVMEVLLRVLQDATDTNGKWVSVDERLPITKEEADKYYEVDSEYPQFIVKIKEGVTAGMLEFDGEDWFDVNGYVYNVTHWMPLPQLPKGVQ